MGARAGRLAGALSGFSTPGLPPRGVRFPPPRWYKPTKNTASNEALSWTWRREGGVRGAVRGGGGGGGRGGGVRGGDEDREVGWQGEDRETRRVLLLNLGGASGVL